MYADRSAGGQALVPPLEKYKGSKEVVVLGLPRGGVPVAYEVARALELPLDVLIVRKLGVPGNPELAMGAIASGDARYLNEDVIRLAGVGAREIEQVEETEHCELLRRERFYRGGRPPLDVKGRTVILVDDGIATGASMRVAARAMRAAGVLKVVVAVPVAPAEAQNRFEGIADEFVCAQAPRSFRAVGQFYDRFDQTTDDEVRGLLDRAQAEAA